MTQEQKCCDKCGEEHTLTQGCEWPPVPAYQEQKNSMDTAWTAVDGYAKQMAENHAFNVDKAFWLVVKQKPKWMPAFLYKAVIKNLINFNELR